MEDSGRFFGAVVEKTEDRKEDICFQSDAFVGASPDTDNDLSSSDAETTRIVQTVELLRKLQVGKRRESSTFDVDRRREHDEHRRDIKQQHQQEGRCLQEVKSMTFIACDKSSFLNEDEVADFNTSVPIEARLNLHVTYVDTIKRDQNGEFNPTDNDLKHFARAVQSLLAHHRPDKYANTSDKDRARYVRDWVAATPSRQKR